MGLLLGAAVGAWAGSRARDLGGQRTKPSLIDWDQARSLAVGMNRQTAISSSERQNLDRYYYDLTQRSIPIVAEMVAATGADVLLLGWGLEDDGAHSPNEKFHIDDFYRGIRASSHLWHHLATVKK